MDEPRTLQSSLSVERILEKGLTVFPKLCGTSACEAVTFYESLQQVSTSYLLLIMPFDMIRLTNITKVCSHPASAPMPTVSAAAQCSKYSHASSQPPTTKSKPNFQVSETHLGMGTTFSGGFWNCLSRALTPQFPLHNQSGCRTCRSWTSARVTCCTSISKPKEYVLFVERSHHHIPLCYHTIGIRRRGDKLAN